MSSRNNSVGMNLPGNQGLDGLTGGRTSLFRHEQQAIDEINYFITKYNIGKSASNINIYNSSTRGYLECDLIITTHSRIYIVELKHWSGRIEIIRDAQERWIINRTNYVDSPHKVNNDKCKILKSIYQNEFRTYPTLWVTSIVVLTNPDSVVIGADSPNPEKGKRAHTFTFASISDFLAFLKKQEKEAEKILTDVQVEAIAKYINSIGRPKRGLEYTVQGYKTLEYLYQTPEHIELIARSIVSHVRGLSRFRIFRPPLDSTKEEKERFVKKALNTLSAVAKIGDHPNIHKVYLIPNDYGDIIEMSDWSETGTLHDFMQQHGAIKKETAFKICKDIATALRTAHKEGVIHRAVKPDNVLMMNGIPKLTNFDLSYQLEDNRLTVIADVSQLKDDGYIAPEILAGEDIDEGTDFFSLGVIAYQLLVGSKPFASTRQLIAKGGKLEKRHVETLEEKGVPQNIINTIYQMILADRTARLKDVEEIIAAFSPDTLKTGDEYTVSHNARLNTGDKHDIYEILEFIGEGKVGQVYKAGTRKQPNVAIKIFNKEVPLERAETEYEIASSIESSYVARATRYGYWADGRFCIEFEFIDGESLRELIERNERPDRDTFRTITLCLLEAVKAFHQHKDENGELDVLLHSDIKPENVIVRGDNKAVLIDCGIAGRPRVSSFEATPGYVPPDCIMGTDMQFSESGDLFALGVTLWEWLFGVKPYHNPAVGDKPELPEKISEEFKDYLPWLQKAVATEAQTRFNDIQDMYDSFLHCDKGVTEKALQLDAVESEDKEQAQADVDTEKGVVALMNIVNPFVKYLNTLTNTSAGNENANAEAQLGNEFFERIYVKNPIADYIYNELINQQRNVILTGNAGDGKTAIAAEVIAKITGRFPPLLQDREELPDSNVVVIKDMSELSSEKQLELLGDIFLNTNKRYLLVSNTGRLLEGMAQVKSSGLYNADERELLEALDADEPKNIYDNKFLLINIGRMDSIDTACKVFQKMIAPNNWEDCKRCQKSEECTIRKNVLILQNNEELVTERVRLVYRRLYEYDERLTMRQMTGHLAYAITSGLDCTDIASFSRTKLQADLFKGMFFNRFFGDDGNKFMYEASKLRPVNVIREAKFGTFLDPSFEREIWIKNQFPPLKEDAQEIYIKLQDSVTENQHAIRQQVRRIVFFFGMLEGKEREEYICNFLRSPSLLDFLSLARGYTDSIMWSNYKHHILHVLKEHFLGIRLPEINRDERLFITLKRSGNGVRTQMVLKTLMGDQFKLKRKPRFQLGDSKSFILCLEYNNGAANLNLDLPFLDYVARRFEGEIAEELSANYVNRLDLFKVELLNANAEAQDITENTDCLTLLRIERDNKFNTIPIKIADDNLVVI